MLQAHTRLVIPTLFILYINKWKTLYLFIYCAALRILLTTTCTNLILKLRLPAIVTHHQKRDMYTLRTRYREKDYVIYRLYYMHIPTTYTWLIFYFPIIKQYSLELFPTYAIYIMHHALPPYYLSILYFNSGMHDRFLMRQVWQCVGLIGPNNE